MKTAMRLLSMVSLASVATLVEAQHSDIRRTEVMRHDIGGSGREAIQVRVEFAPGAAFPVHTHPGEEIAYVLDGTLEYRLAGALPVTLHAGEAVFVPADTPHSAKNVGASTAIELATYVVEKGRPLVVLAN